LAVTRERFVLLEAAALAVLMWPGAVQAGRVGEGAKQLWVSRIERRVLAVHAHVTKRLDGVPEAVVLRARAAGPERGLARLQLRAPAEPQVPNPPVWRWLGTDPDEASLWIHPLPVG